MSLRRGPTSRTGRRALLGLGVAAVLTAIPVLASCATAIDGRADSKPVNPSGMAMPKSLPGWRLTFGDEFNGSALNTKDWGKYSGVPPNALSRWAPSQVQVGDGMLTLKGTRNGNTYLTGGVSSAGAGAQQYGRWDVRMRIDKGNGIKFVTLLWPRAEHWPPEIDFAEDGGGQRKAITSTVIWGTAADKQQQQIRAEADFSDWHTVSVEWSPKKVVFLLDGHVTGTVTDDRAVIPHEPMWLGIQTEQVACSQWTTCVDSTTPANVDMQIDWAAQYTADSSVGAGGGSGSGTKATSKHSLVKAVYYKPAPGASRVRLRGAHVPHKRFKVIVVGKHHVHRTRYAVNQAERAKARKVRDGVYAFRLRPHQLEAGKNVLRLSVAAPKQAKTKMKVRFHY